MKENERKIIDYAEKYSDDPWQQYSLEEAKDADWLYVERLANSVLAETIERNGDNPTAFFSDIYNNLKYLTDTDIVPHMERLEELGSGDTFGTYFATDKDSDEPNYVIFYGRKPFMDPEIRAHESFGHGVQERFSGDGIFTDSIILCEGAAEMIAKIAYGDGYKPNEYYKHNEIFVRQIRDIVTPESFYQHLLYSRNPESIAKEFQELTGRDDCFQDIKDVVRKWGVSSVLAGWLDKKNSTPYPVNKKLQSTFVDSANNAKSWGTLSEVDTRFNSFAKNHYVYKVVEREYEMARERKIETLPKHFTIGNSD